MIKKLILILLVVFGLSFNTSIAQATSSSSGSFFGGTITSSPAFEILELESTGWSCYVPGQTISIAPIGSPEATPTSYLIPSLVTPQTRTTVRGFGQLIIGRYLGMSFIPCQYPATPPLYTVVYLSTINLFGTSR